MKDCIQVTLPASKTSLGLDVDESLQIIKLYDTRFLDHGIKCGYKLVKFQGYVLTKKSDIITALIRWNNQLQGETLYPGDSKEFVYEFEIPKPNDQ
tara:strand:- start:107 stop:394 length:288 start_codon:yes stop_codon:yes gene_type:complete